MVAHNLREKFALPERLAMSQPELAAILFGEMIKKISLESLVSDKIQGKAKDRATGAVKNIASRVPILQNISSLMGNKISSVLSALDMVGKLE